MIVAMILITEREGSVFMNQLNSKIKELQAAGYKVEIQYSNIEGYYSALIIVKE